jgi:RNA-directed DNA polymerase
LMERLARRIEDRRLLRLIRRYLEAGVMLHGVVVERYEGTPQGGPLSPLLANVLLDEVDKELERCGHTFSRYADDCNIYVRSRRAGERVLQRLRIIYQGLRLRINESKSAVARAETRKFLGFSFWYGPKGAAQIRVAAKARMEMQEVVREITRRTVGRGMVNVVRDLRQYLIGWKNYYKLAETPRMFSDLDQWIRHRIRALQLKYWKKGTTMFREIRKLGASESLAAKIAAHGRRWWHTSGKYLHIVLTNNTLDKMGVPRLAA